MTIHKRPPRGRLSLATLLFAVLAACSGCGGSSGTSNDTTPPPTGPSGLIWYSVGANDARTLGAGVRVVGVTNPAQMQAISSDVGITPWPDGTQYADYTLGANGMDLLEVKSTATSAVLSRVQMQRYSDRIQPSPVNKSVVLTTWAADFISDTQGEFWVMDLAAGRFLRSEPIAYKRMRYTWMPDGRLLRVHDETGELAVATVDGPWQAAGRLAVPANNKINFIRVNPQGTQLLVGFRDYLNYASDVKGPNGDLWLAALNGTNLQRYTANSLAFTGYWSPDGQYIVFDRDSATCGPGDAQYCSGSCSSWYAPATARDLSGMMPGSVHATAKEVLHVVSGATSPKNVGCVIRGWTP